MINNVGDFSKLNPHSRGEVAGSSTQCASRAAIRDARVPARRIWVDSCETQWPNPKNSVSSVLWRGPCQECFVYSRTTPGTQATEAGSGLHTFPGRNGVRPNDGGR